MIGTSLSKCVKDILKGEVSIEDVDLIVAGTKAENAQHWEEVFDHYMKTYWNNDYKAVLIAEQLIKSGKVRQPRVEGKAPPRGPYWVNSEDEIQYCS